MPDEARLKNVLVVPTGRATPAGLGMTETFDASVVQVILLTRTLLLRRNPLRTGIVFLAPQDVRESLAVFPRYPDDAEVLLLPRQTGIIPITMDLYRSAVMSEWWGYSEATIGVSIIELQLI